MTPEPVSSQTNDTVTSPACHPADDAGVITGRTIGAVVSMLTCTVAVAALPARSRATPTIGWTAPSPLTVTGVGQLAIPDPPSAQVNVTPTGALCHPAAFAAGVTD